MHIKDEAGSVCSGSIINGLFEGSIQTRNGTYYIEPMEANTDHGSPNAHSYIYHENDIDYSLLESVNSSLVSAIYQKLKNLRTNIESQEEWYTRTKRSIDVSRTTCLLYVKADYLFCRRFGSVERVIAQIDGLLKAVNTIYERAEFHGIKHINFKVKKLDIFTDKNPSDPMHSSLIGVEKLLELHSERNWNSYCLSYLFTNRDYSGVIGLAWEGKIGNYGGICSKTTKFGKVLKNEASLNTGLVTVQTFGQPLPPRVIGITLAHELAHSLGAPHDGGKECERFEAGDKQGSYLMFPYAVDENQYHSNWFSACTIDFIGKILHSKKDQCFVESDRPICGNRLVEEGEECDVGSKDTDLCCFGANEATELQCKLRPGKLCSPSQGLCCNHECSYAAQGAPCQKESECAFESYCTGASAKCLKPSSKPNYTVCHLETKICMNGLCMQSLCTKYGLEKCDCETSSMYEKCQLCCQQPGNAQTCAGTSSTLLLRYFNGRQISLPPGSPCGDRQGYCDKFHMCRLVDADGPIARLKNKFLGFIEIEDIASWMKTRWWAILLMILTLAAIMAGTVFLLGRTLDSDKVEKGFPVTKASLRMKDHVLEDRTDFGVEEDSRAVLRRPVMYEMEQSIVFQQREETFFHSSFVEFESRM
ncbi:disintegrin and metalloproteinase domain-containing protein 10-like isoform X2 [Ambystoma mexicanum]|uniref:disintegrin and metalloproteinase domain-containing protein 10-like isoform X2 n=1 Tax=Ambystoma mexicanum TaxID=8296 RepID=UPI0037E958E7